MTRRHDALVSCQQLRDAEREVSDARTDEAALRVRLVDALTQAAARFDPAQAADLLAVAAQEVLNREGAA